MKTYDFNHFDVNAFLSEYWQKKPVLLKGLFKDFDDPISPDELAGLAAEQEVESRLIAKQGEDWQVEHGPFEDYQEYGEKDWTLLVQAVDHWWEEGADLVDAFRFLPNWRIDDLMISFSTQGGGVGPHLDQYDVFIIQGMGKRHWRVGEQQTLNSITPHPDLLQVSQFNACIDDVLEPGDVLYIPPNCPHEGYAIENAMNYSVGFRAPNQQDFISSFADYALAEECFDQRYTDKDYQQQSSIADVDEQAQAKIKQLMLSALDDKTHFNKWLGQYLSAAKHDLDLHQPEPHCASDDVVSMIKADEGLRRVGGLRCLFIGDDFFINGEHWFIKEKEVDLAKYIAVSQELSIDILKRYTFSFSEMELLTKLVNEGYLYSLA